MHRLLVASEVLSAAIPELAKEAARHLKVLRPEVGEEIELFDGRGKFRLCRYEREGLRFAGELCESVRPSRGLVLFACVTKGSRWDWTIEKATELGVTRIVPVISDRTIVRIAKDERAAKRERWLRIAEDAARQSDAKWVPEIDEAVDFKDSLALVKATECFVGALTKPPSPMLARSVSAAKSNLPLATFIGPEGDFTSEELAALIAIAHPTSFGDTILRAETAAIYALSVIKGCSPILAGTSEANMI